MMVLQGMHVQRDLICDCHAVCDTKSIFADAGNHMQAELDEEAARAEQADRELNEREREGLADGMSPSGRPDDEAQGPGAVRSISMLQTCRDVQVFEKIRRISEGTYGVVYQ